MKRNKKNIRMAGIKNKCVFNCDKISLEYQISKDISVDPNLIQKYQLAPANKNGIIYLISS